jgi:hypothetical protein
MPNTANTNYQLNFRLNFYFNEIIDSQFTKINNIQRINDYTNSITKIILFPTSLILKKLKEVYDITLLSVCLCVPP